VWEVGSVGGEEGEVGEVCREWEGRVGEGGLLSQTSYSHLFVLS